MGLYFRASQRMEENCGYDEEIGKSSRSARSGPVFQMTWFPQSKNHEGLVRSHRINSVLGEGH